MNDTIQDNLMTEDAEDEFMNRKRDWSKARRRPDKVIPRRALVQRTNPLTAADAIGYAVCLSHSGYTQSLIPFKIYPVLPNETEEAYGWIRIIDEEGNDMLYLAEDFAAIEVPIAVEDAIKHLERAA